MRPALLLVCSAALWAGCGGDDEPGYTPSRQDAERLTSATAPDGPYTRASCVELPDVRQFRCSATKDSTTAYFKVYVSKDGQVAQYDQL